MPNVFSAIARRVLVGRRNRAHQSASLSLPFEALESRTHLSVSQNAEGWTVVGPEADSRVVYVSRSSGDDGNSGLSPDKAVQSVAKGVSLIRDHSADQLLFKRGDTWTNESLGNWYKSGKSADQPILISAYGEGERPRINTGEEGGMSLVGNGEQDIHHVSLIGIQLTAHTRLPGADFKGTGEAIGIRVLADTSDFLIEDCYVSGYTSNIVFQRFFGELTDFRVRRSVVVDAYSIPGKGHSQGLYAEGVTGLTIEENLFDHNGWSEQVPGASATAFNHNVYLRADNTGVVVRNNVIANASSHGLQARAGGIVENNLFLDNAVGMSFGRVNGSPGTANGVTGYVKGNVFMGGAEREINGVTRGWALDLANTRKGADVTVSENIFAGDGSGKFPAIVIGVGDEMENKSETAGVNDLTIRNNVIHRFEEGIRLDGNLHAGEQSPDGLNGLVIRNNDFQRLGSEPILHDMPYNASAETWTDNRYSEDNGARPDITMTRSIMRWERWKSDHEPSAKNVKVDYPDASRTIATYNASVGGEATTEAFLAELRKSSSQNWRPQYAAAPALAYVKAGFAEGGVLPPSGDPGTRPEPGEPPHAPVNPDPAPGGEPSAAPVATASVPGQVDLTVGDAALTFSVTYIDDTGGINLATIGDSDLRVVGKKQYDEFATFVSVEPVPGGNAAVATYAIKPPDGETWQRADRGTYRIISNPDAVLDTNGIPLQENELAEFKVNVAKPAPVAKPSRASERPLTIRRLKASTRGGTITVSATFSKDVSTSIDATDLLVLAEDGTRAVDPAQVALAYDPAKFVATWTLPATLAEGKYRLTLPAAPDGITDVTGQALDGDRDGQSGGDFVSPRWLKI